MPTTVHFDPESLRESLAALSAWQRIAFAASCVEVLVPSYAKLAELEEVGDPDLVRSTLDGVWSGLKSPDRIVDPAGLPSPDSVKELLPAEEDWNEWAPQAEDAVAALVYLVELLRHDDVDLAAYTAERAYSAADEFEAREQEPGAVDADGREALLGSSSIQAELRRQTDALRRIQDGTTESSIITELRAAANRVPIGGEALNE